MWIYQALPRALKITKNYFAQCTLIIVQNCEVACMDIKFTSVDVSFFLSTTQALYTLQLRVLPHTREKHSIEKGVTQHWYI